MDILGTRNVVYVISFNSFKNSTGWYCCLFHKHIRHKIFKLNSILFSLPFLLLHFLCVYPGKWYHSLPISVAQAWLLIILNSSPSTLQPHRALLIPPSKHLWNPPTFPGPGCHWFGPDHHHLSCTIATTFYLVALVASALALLPHPHSVCSPHSSQRDHCSMQIWSHSSPD